ncbi:hypothetical protein [Flavobacterium pectinovorum]|uniref:DUF4595 domain-containing protein n=1 Tax=Flavobacterium pectinovorum TaxID=29533 RepID=A0A502EL28_9FLAO|nr:hypothetical protein [Flavobacterium pectinovorum]TPG38157.1 hypothetical protein EAH81_17140 [Flavobacterium pectinovorum]
MKNLLLLFGTLTLVFTSCSSNDSLTDSNTETAFKLTKIVHLTPDYSVMYFTDIKYDGNKIVSSTDNNGYVAKYTYTGELITKVEEFQSFTVLENIREYTYLNGKMSIEIQRMPNETKYLEIKYTHNTDGTIAYDRREINSASGKIITSSGKYAYKNGNIIKNEIMNKGQVDIVFEYEYDTKKNPLSNILGLNLLLNGPLSASLNNMIKMSNASTAQQRTFLYSYYNNDFPSEQKRLGNGGGLEEIIKYTY